MYIDIYICINVYVHKNVYIVYTNDTKYKVVFPPSYRSEKTDICLYLIETFLWVL